jgi:LDH2 family malate/lactate/ureidoglycolate dehydrogenase
LSEAAAIEGVQRPRYRASDLLAYATALLENAGLSFERAHIVAEVLLEGDLLGHSTHGLDLLAPYLRELDTGRMARAGDPDTLSDLGSTLTWDGRYLPGPWLVRTAIGVARARLPMHHVVTVVIRRSHHLACLQAYLREATDAGLLMVLTCSDPAAAGVTPHGAVSSRITPNPIAAGIPTAHEPILIDVSMSSTTNAMTRRVAAEHGRLPGSWVVDADGQATNDPTVLFGERPGAVLPLGGLDLGHKGFALALLVEALTSALAGHGRADEPREWGASVFLQLIDPEGFGGRPAFLRETSWLAELCRTAPVPPGRPPVRLPGEAALARRRRQLSEGVMLYDATVPALAPWAERYRVTVPAPIA